ncbi:LRRCT domain-containing protein [Caerostris darwini]|uniref:LRRCT domain-containing protein n=1 Tax=Caerostris darwini TaxID=1538125 RepID=A0AAV4TXN0_9ARAC|nr:LRRCT domain-containing protein [Caerostris darwini]
MGENLDVLELSGNQMEELPERAFANLQMLNSLDLENNRIRNIHPKAFEGIESSLEWLKLGDNELPTVPAQSLRRLRKLRQLDLRQNRIERIAEDDFRHYGRTLKFIYLQKNRLHTIEVNALNELDSLVWLYLPSNQLSVAPYETFRAVLDTLQILDLHENPFTCDCRIAWFRDLVNDQKSRVVNMPRETRCDSPPLLKGKAIAYVTGHDLGCVVDGGPPALLSAHPLLLLPLLLWALHT